jgi:hypothetical protein
MASLHSHFVESPATIAGFNRELLLSADIFVVRLTASL